VGDALTSVLFGVVAWWGLPRGVRGAQAEVGWASLGCDPARPQNSPGGPGHGIHRAGHSSAGSSYGLQVTTLGFSDATYGALLSLNGLLVVLFELPLTTRSRRFPSRPVMAVGYLLMGAGLVLNAAFHRLPALVIGMAVFTLGEMIFAPVAIAYVASLAPPRMRGRYMGAWVSPTRCL